MDSPATYTRLIEPRLLESLEDSPVVLIDGPRQCGKTTLARQVGQRLGYAYFSFDDDAMLAAALSDPVGFIDDLPQKVVLDEVQRAPELFRTIKATVDRNRTPGRFLLTGSANVLVLPRLSDSLAGRMSILRLHPLSQSELAGAQPGFLDCAFSGGFPVTSKPRLKEDLASRIVAGGYPAALARADARRRARWYHDDLITMVQRDVRDISRIASLEALPRLLALTAGQTARLVNASDLAAPFQLSRPTIRAYTTLLANVYLLAELLPWHANLLSRLVKTPKLHIGDTGLACALLGTDAPALWGNRDLLGQLAETFVFQELQRQASWHEDPVTFYHLRNRDGVEVDMVMESRGRVVGIEVKTSATFQKRDLSGLRKLRAACGDRFKAGIVLYDGEVAAPMGDGMYVVPIRQLWEKA
ncbi:MAG: ATP-binding protein [Candidatus Hydrogenedentes bacterium]|nr:ATP-binding protein [Candidatus Hydrogenedentota bacterium]